METWSFTGKVITNLFGVQIQREEILMRLAFKVIKFQKKMNSSKKKLFEDDGNFVLYTKKHEVVWAPDALWIAYHVTNIWNRPDTVYLSDQGQLIFTRYGKQKWATPKISEC